MENASIRQCLMEAKKTITIGLDFGSDSVRAIAVDARSGCVIAEGIADYRRWKEKRYCNPPKQVYRQHPLDYIEAMTDAVHTLFQKIPDTHQTHIAGIGVDATGSTVCPVDRRGVPLAMHDSFADNPSAMFYLWKDHSSVAEADEINKVFTTWGGYDYTRYQGQYSSEWIWAKALHAARYDATVNASAFSWVELADWIPALLSARTNPDTMYRCFCAAGHKALWHKSFHGLPAQECLALLDPSLSEISKHFAAVPGMSTDKVGILSKEWQERLGIPYGIIVAGSSLDAHAGAVGAGIKPGTLVKVIGTSTVDMTVVSEEQVQSKSLSTLCGLAQNSILPGYLGLESGQSAFGDIFAWFRRLLMWAVDDSAVLDVSKRDSLSDKLLSRLEACMPKDDVPYGVTALDWFNGRRYPENNDRLKSTLIGLSLSTDAPHIYKSLVKAAVFGAHRVFSGITQSGIVLNNIIAVRGIAHKSPYIMQLIADTMNRTVQVASSVQTCALGAAMYAAVAAGLHTDLISAQSYMGCAFEHSYIPDAKRHRSLESQYNQYLKLAKITDEWFERE